MLPLERKKKILEELYEKKKVLVVELAEKFNVTQETIRRDLNKLEQENIVEKSYGGAVLLEDNAPNDLPIVQRQTQNREGKEIIAQKVCDFLADGDRIMLDSSSTSFYLSIALAKSGKKLTIITNSVKIVCFCMDYDNLNVFLAGGKLNHSTQSMQGAWTKENLRKYHVNYAIFACKGIDMNKGVKDANEEEAELKQIMAESADKVILMADSTKLDKSSFVDLISFKNVDFLATDLTVSKEWSNFLKKSKIQLI